MDLVAGFFLLIFVGKSVQKNPPGKSPQIYTTKIPDTFLQSGQTKRFFSVPLSDRQSASHKVLEHTKSGQAVDEWIEDKPVEVAIAPVWLPSTQRSGTFQGEGTETTIIILVALKRCDL